MEFQESIDPVIQKLDSLDQTRENVLRLTRKLNRVSGRGIAKLVRFREYSTYLDKSRSIMKEIVQNMSELVDITSWSITTSGTEEYAEFEILHTMTTKKEVPNPDSINVPAWIWISALGDTIGELRRMMINKIIDQDLTSAKVYLGYIQELYDAIVGVEFSKSLVPNLRRKIDIARTLIDKCESDFANAVVNKRTKSTSS